MIAYALQQTIDPENISEDHLARIIRDTIARNGMSSTYKCKPFDIFSQWSIFPNGGWTIQPLELERIS